MRNSGYEQERAAWIEWRRERDRFFAHHYASPLPEERMGDFKSLEYFDFNPEMVFQSRLQPRSKETIEIVASTGSRTAYRVAGVVAVPFAVGTRDLVALQGEEDEMFIPFRDDTCGAGTYGGGRYVSPILLRDGTLRVDFNRAVNPYCAYDSDFSCPLPPAQNRLPFRVDAGERDYR
jgi:uncharacterized protein (DUF1684 family)